MSSSCSHLTLDAGVALQSTGGAITFATSGSYTVAAGAGGSIVSTDHDVIISKALAVTRAADGTASTYHIKAGGDLSVAAARRLRRNMRMNKSRASGLLRMSSSIRWADCMMQRRACAPRRSLRC